MFSQYFGQYLLTEKYLTGEQLKIALEYQQSVRLKLGVLAINAGYMNSQQANQVHQMQSKVDKRFGELAVEAGYIKEEQIEELLSSQKFGHLLLAQALIDKNYMSLEKFERAIYEYKKKYNISESQFSLLQGDDVDEIINIYVNLEDEKYGIEIKQYIALFMRNIIRFIDSEVYANKIMKVKEFKTKCVVSQRIKNSINFMTYINAEQDVFLKIASRYAEEELSIVDEMAKDSVGEFLNLNNGLYLVGMSNKGVELDMEPQSVCFEKEIASTYVFPIELPFGKMELIISTM
ncbi:MAG TPA: chemotaxis protein CheX [Clostridium sp.]|uniref:chemotaxis protein CheX n=1 Tax=Clostridium sp. TaxID=1506 RepID=UPI002F94714F